MLALDHEILGEKYRSWLSRIATSHHAENHRVNDEAWFAHLAAPLDHTSVALVTTAGAHVRGQEPFSVDTVAGDPTFRLIPGDVATADLRFSHTHYDTASAEQDPNVVFPIDRLRESAAAGRIGAVSTVHIGMMGFNPDPTEIADVTAGRVASILADAGAGAVLLVPG